MKPIVLGRGQWIARTLHAGGNPYRDIAWVYLGLLAALVVGWLGEKVLP